MSSRADFSLPSDKLVTRRGISVGWFVGVTLGLTLAVLALAIILFFRPVGTDTQPGTSDAAALAEALADAGLPRQAAERLAHAARQAPTETEQAELWFRAGEQFAAANAWADAAASYVLAEQMGADALPKQGLALAKTEALTMLNSEAALDALERQVSLNPDGTASADESVVVAQLGGRSITDRDLDRIISENYDQQMGAAKLSMPEESYRAAKRKFLDELTPEQRLQQLHTHVNRELLYREAMATQLGREDEVLQELDNLRRTWLADVLAARVLAKSMSISEQDLQDFYANRQEEYRGEDGTVPPFEDLRPEILQRKFEVERNSALGELIDRLRNEHDVFIYEQQFSAANAGATPESAP